LRRGLRHKHLINRLLTLLTALTLLASAPALAESRLVSLHETIEGQKQVSRLIWLGGLELDFDDQRTLLLSFELLP